MIIKTRCFLYRIRNTVIQFGIPRIKYIFDYPDVTSTKVTGSISYGVYASHIGNGIPRKYYSVKILKYYNVYSFLCVFLSAFRQYIVFNAGDFVKTQLIKLFYAYFSVPCKPFFPLPDVVSFSFVQYIEKIG